VISIQQKQQLLALETVEEEQEKSGQQHCTNACKYAHKSNVSVAPKGAIMVFKA
jgi:hypothetical protein